MFSLWVDINLELNIDPADAMELAVKGTQTVKEIVAEADNNGFIFLRYFTKKDCKPRIRLRVSLKETFDLTELKLILDSMKSQGKLTYYEGPTKIVNTDIEADEYWKLGQVASKIALDYSNEFKGWNASQISRFTYYLLNSLGYPESFIIKASMTNALSLIYDVFPE